MPESEAVRIGMAGPSAFGPLRPFANPCRVSSVYLLQGSKAWPPGSQSCRGLACSGSMHRAGRDPRAGGSAHVLRAGLRPSLPLCFAASPARRSRWLACRVRCQSPLAHRIGSAGRVAQPSEGGDVGRRRASGDMSAAARPAGPIPHLSTLGSGPRNRPSRTPAKGRKVPVMNRLLVSANIDSQSNRMALWTVHGLAREAGWSH